MKKHKGANTMSRHTYTPAVKTKVVLEVLWEEQELGEIAAEYKLSPNMVRNWKCEFLDMRRPSS